MALRDYPKVLLRAARLLATRRILSWRIRARHPTMICDPTAIWNYAYADLDDIEIGANVSVLAYSEIIVYRRSPRSPVPGKLVLRDHAAISFGVNIRAAGGRIEIGAHSAIAQNCVLVAANHTMTHAGNFIDAPWDETRTGVIVGDNVWVGANCTLLPGCRIGDNVIIAAGSFVRGVVPADELWGGNPARRLHSLARPTDIHVIDVDATPNVRVLDLIGQEVRGLDPARLTLPLDQTGIDSFDLMSLRIAIEEKLGRTIPDREWSGITTLADIAKLPSLAASAVPRLASLGPASLGDASLGPASLGDASHDGAPVAPATAQTTAQVQITAAGRAHRRYTLNMPQMALSGLGESWLFKELGDIHWGMITAFLNSPSSGIADAAGDRLYATFTRIRLQVDPGLRSYRENEPFEITSSLERYGTGMFFGHHDVAGSEARCRVQTMSTFAKYGERGANTSLIKGSPVLPDPDALPSLPSLPVFGAEYRQRRATEPAGLLFECDYDILPSHDINGVGLLYFAAYPTIFDLCIERFEGKGFLIGSSTVSKDILYFANSEPTETLLFRLHARGKEGDSLHHTASLSRKSDGKRMSEVVSVKRRLQP